MRRFTVLVGLVAISCGSDTMTPDAGEGPPDARLADASPADAALADAALLDAALADAALLDAALPDAALLDAALPDAALLDAALPDAAVVDAAVPDAAVADAAVADAAGPDAALGLVTVRVFDGEHLPLPGAYVVRQREDQVLSTTQTGSGGAVTILVEPGDSVTAAYRDPRFVDLGVYRLLTWQSVEAGDVLTFGEPDRGPEFATVHAVSPAPFDLAQSYYATSGCQEGQEIWMPGPFEYPIHARCHRDPAHVPVLLEALFGGIRAYAATEGAVVDGVVDVTVPAWRTDTLAFTSHIEGFSQPPNWGAAIILEGGGGETFAIPRDFQCLGQGTGVGTGSDQLTLQVPYGLGATWLYLDDVVPAYLPTGGQAASARVIAGALPMPATMTLEPGDLLPTILTVRYDLEDDPTRWVISWALDGSSDDMDAAVATAALKAEDGVIRWTVVAGPGTTTVELPPLPDAMAAFRPIFYPMWTTVVLLAADDADGVDAYRSFRPFLIGTADWGEDFAIQIMASGARQVRTSYHNF